jgi:hypothetical protein
MCHSTLCIATIMTIRVLSYTALLIFLSTSLTTSGMSVVSWLFRGSLGISTGFYPQQCHLNVPITWNNFANSLQVLVDKVYPELNRSQRKAVNHSTELPRS